MPGPREGVANNAATDCHHTTPVSTCGQRPSQRPRLLALRAGPAPPVESQLGLGPRSPRRWRGVTGADIAEGERARFRTE